MADVPVATNLYADRLFNRIDTNMDGTITLPAKANDVATVQKQADRMAPLSEIARIQARMRSKGDFLHEAGSDGKGFVRLALFEAADADGNRQVSRAEMQAVIEGFDRDHDGVFTEAEAAAMDARLPITRLHEADEPVRPTRTPAPAAAKKPTAS